MHKIRHMNKILSILLCVAILFCAFSAPFNVSAIVGVDDAIYLTIATICLSLGASIAFNNPNTGEEILNYAENIWNHLDPFTQSIIRSKIANVGGFVPINDLGMWYSAYVDWSTSEWQQIGSDIISYFNGTGSTDPQYNFLDVTPNESGKIGFTQNSVFSISMPSACVKNEIYQADLGKSYLYFGRIEQSILSGLFPEMGIPASGLQNPMYYANIMNDDGFCQVECLSAGSSSMYPAGSFVSQKSNVSASTSAEGYYVALSDKGDFIRLFLSPFNNTTHYYTYQYILWYDKNNITYNLTTFTGAGGNVRWAFVSTVDGTHYKNMDFSNYHSAICWFAQSCGLSMPNSTFVPDDYVAHPSTSDDVINLDTSKAQENLHNQVSNAVDDTINTVVAGNIDDLKILADDPTLITNPTAAADVIVVYPSDLPEINATGNFWTTKFPFCLPWDIYNLIIGFSSTQQAPILHFLVFPADSFGIDTPDTYIDIDFTDYYQAVQIFRFFIKIEFVLALIFVTKRLIK